MVTLGRDQLDVAKSAFEAARKLVEQSKRLKDDEKKLLFGTSRLEDAQQVVAESMAKCEAKQGSSKARKWLHKASELICHYGTILDVFVQHHPEYVSLVWGLWELAFTSIVNHGETLKMLAKSIAQVGARLPRIKIVSELYPIGQMRMGIESLYAEILTFLLKAHEWCNESRLQRVLYSITKPPTLKYGDTLARIEDLSRDIIELAAVASQREIRVMHTSQHGQLENIIARLEAADRDRDVQLRGLYHIVSSLGISHGKPEEKVDLMLSLLNATGLTINDLLAKADSG
ncbi:hypothetical protein LQW54_001535 [Pestalotiopsis sp. IQ-011]